jgi:hypothetical protein
MSNHITPHHQDFADSLAEVIKDYEGIVPNTDMAAMFDTLAFSNYTDPPSALIHLSSAIIHVMGNNDPEQINHLVGTSVCIANALSKYKL